jgi:hypothetical protein
MAALAACGSPSRGGSVTILVCGSRDWTDGARIRARLEMVPYVQPDVPCLIHGAARGADTLAGNIARNMGWSVDEFPADWRGKGKAAGVIRNLTMLDQCPDVVLAFQKNGSSGTQHTIDEARRRGIPVEVFT